jgi:signal peptidase I
MAATVTTRTRSSRRPDRRPALSTTVGKGLSTLLLVVAFCALGIAGYEVETGRWHATPVLSGSMRPAMRPGDIVITQRVPISDLRVRDVVVFNPPGENAHQTVHRIVKLTMKGTTTSITTWGDANLVPDAAVSSLRGDAAYRVVRVVPLVGYPAIWLQNGNRGLLAMALGAILLIAATVTILRPDKPAKPPGPDHDPGDKNDDGDASDNNDDHDPADSSADPLKATAC